MLKKSRRIKHVDKVKLKDLMQALHASKIDDNVEQQWLSFPANAAMCRQKLGVLGWEYGEDDKYGHPLFIADAIEELGLRLGTWNDASD